MKQKRTFLKIRSYIQRWELVLLSQFMFEPFCGMKTQNLLMLKACLIFWSAARLPSQKALP